MKKETKKNTYEKFVLAKDAVPVKKEGYITPHQRFQQILNGDLAAPVVDTLTDEETEAAMAALESAPQDMLDTHEAINLAADAAKVAKAKAEADAFQRLVDEEIERRKAAASTPPAPHGDGGDVGTGGAAPTS